MKVANVTLIRGEHETSAIMNSTYIEEVRGYATIEFGPKHTVFVLEDGNIIAYLANRVFEVATYEE
jgi:hypothetical protein